MDARELTDEERLRALIEGGTPAAEAEAYIAEMAANGVAWAAFAAKHAEFLAARRADGLLIDPVTAECTWWWAGEVDSYALGWDGVDNINRQWFARAPGAEYWVSFDDLPEETKRALDKRMKAEAQEEAKTKTKTKDTFDLSDAKEQVDDLRKTAGKDAKAAAEKLIDKIVEHLKGVEPTLEQQAAAVKWMAVNQRGHCDNLRDLVAQGKRGPDELYLQVQWLPALEAAAVTMREYADRGGNDG